MKSQRLYQVATSEKPILLFPVKDMSPRLARRAGASRHSRFSGLFVESELRLSLARYPRGYYRL